jgi:hypothetical protein
MTELHCTRLLSKGLHKLRVENMQVAYRYGEEVEWRGPGLPKQPISASYIKH